MLFIDYLLTFSCALASRRTSRITGRERSTGRIPEHSAARASLQPVVRRRPEAISLRGDWYLFGSFRRFELEDRIWNRLIHADQRERPRILQAHSRIGPFGRV